MAKDRVPKINELIKRELNKILLDELDSSALITITRVETSSNFIHSKIFVSVLPEEKTDGVFKDLNNQIFDIQQSLNKRLKTRPVPKIRFIKEQEVRKAADIEEVLKDIEK